MLSTPACVSFKSSNRLSNSGPISETVARTGCPCSPNTSRKRPGKASPVKFVDLELLGPLDDFRIVCARLAQAARSPLTSAMNTATPRALKFSASVCSVTVFSGSRGAGNQAVAVRHFRQQKNRLLGLRDENGFGHTAEL